MITIPGSELANKILEEVKSQAAGKSLRIILATDDPAARTYTSLKKSRAAALGIDCEIIEIPNFAREIPYPETASNTMPAANQPWPEYDHYIKDVIETVRGISAERATIVQLPLYPALELHRRAVLDAINLNKDADGLTSDNLRRTLAGDLSATPPATVSAILEILSWVGKQEGMNLRELVKGKSVVIVNDSDLIGRPLAAMLEQMSAETTICNKYTLDLRSETLKADILISATGKVALISADMVRPGTIGIDVGSIKTADGVRGDFAQDAEMLNKLSYFTPVPGGVGPLTIACLLRNAVNA
jgi:methylenetetrahydrofolate dehydrogenase (NADP+) / methenyltetrahydrofolate cyclohydrolase